MCDLDGEVAEVQDTYTRRARKDYWCCACGDKIERTHLYKRTGALFDGSWSTYRHCLRCWAMLDAIFKRGESASWYLDCGESWEDVFGELPDDVARLAFMTPEEAQQELSTKRAAHD